MKSGDTGDLPQVPAGERRPATSDAPHVAYQFGDLELDAVLGRLTRRGRPVNTRRPLAGSGTIVASHASVLPL